MMKDSATAYRIASAEGATVIGLMIVVYDALARDLYTAAQTCREGEISARCRSLKHALDLLGHLESWLDSTTDGSLTESLRLFYSVLRQQMIVLQAAPEAAKFQALAEMVSSTRAVWLVKEQNLTDRLKDHETMRVDLATTSQSEGELSTRAGWSV